MVILLMLVGGLALLVTGAEVLIRGAARLAASFGVSALVIGLTVVAFGTSSPEIAVSVWAAYTGSGDLAVGNIVGSNIFNVLFTLGLCALIAPLGVSRQLVRLDVPVMIGVSALLLLFGLDRTISRLEGLLLLGGLVAYTVFVIVTSRRETLPMRAEYEKEFGVVESPSIPRNGLLVLVGLGLLVLGSRYFVTAATEIARLLGVSDLVIGLTIVAAGTSLPEVATSAVATVRGERDIAVGNIVGSNIFNLLLVGGAASALAAGGLGVADVAVRVDLPLMILVAVACLPVFFTGLRVDRWEGAMFLGYYVAYSIYLALSSTDHIALPVYGRVMAQYVIPLTMVLLAGVSYRAWKTDREVPAGA